MRNMNYYAYAVWSDEMTGETMMESREFETEEEAVHWAKLNDGVVVDLITNEIIYW